MLTAVSQIFKIRRLNKVYLSPYSSTSILIIYRRSAHVWGTSSAGPHSLMIFVIDLSISSCCGLYSSLGSTLCTMGGQGLHQGEEEALLKEDESGLLARLRWKLYFVFLAEKIAFHVFVGFKMKRKPKYKGLCCMRTSAWNLLLEFGSRKYFLQHWSYEGERRKMISERQLIHAIFKEVWLNIFNPKWFLPIQRRIKIPQLFLKSLFAALNLPNRTGRAKSFP